MTLLSFKTFAKELHCKHRITRDAVAFIHQHVLKVSVLKHLVLAVESCAFLKSLMLIMTKSEIKAIILRMWQAPTIGWKRSVV